MAVNNPIKRYSKDIGVPVPEVRFGPSERPRLNTMPAPYLPLQLENERHDEYYVILTGKVIALDSRGFVVPAGYALQLELIQAAATGGDNWDDAALGNIERYTQIDVDNGVVNARGVTVVLNEPVLRAFHTDAAAGGAENLLTGAVPAASNALSVGNHIGVAPYSFLRAASDVISRALNENELHPAAKSGPEALMPYDPTQLRSLAWQLQNRVTALVADECLVLPVVEDRTGVLIEGQCVAIGAAMSDFPLGSYVTFDEMSDFVPADSAAVAMANLTPDYDTDADADITDAVLGMRQRLVGQVVRRNTRFPSSYLDKVKTRWESTIPGFTDIDRMPGSATLGYPWRMHTAGATLGEIQVSLLMR